MTDCAFVQARIKCMAVIRRWLYLQGGCEAGLYCITDTLVGWLGSLMAPFMVSALAS